MKNETTFKKWLIEKSFAILAIVVAVANLWLFAKLTPISLHLSETDGKVIANEKQIETIQENIQYIRNRLDDVYLLIAK